MVNRLLFIVIISFFIFPSSLLSQKDKDDGYIDDYLNENILDFIYSSRPMIELNYGIGYPGHTNIISKFAAIGHWDFKLGKSERKIYKGILLDLNERYIFGSYMSSSQQSIYDNDNKLRSTYYRFGFGSRDGIGYGGSFLSVTPYISQDFVWTKLSDYTIPTEQTIQPSEEDPSILNNYYGTFRFGDRATYGVKLEFASMFQINPYYETSVVYRRHLFWYWSGSFILSGIGYNVLSRFTEEIVENSPVIGPVFNFLLKAGYLYGYYLLRKEDMNWPFNPNGNQPAFTFETFNIGFSIVF